LAKGKVLVIGLGEVGRALFELLKESRKFEVFGFDIDKEKMHAVGQKTLPKKVDVVHVCIPCFNQAKFLKNVESSVKQFKPKLLIINSTVPPGTTQTMSKRCDCLVAHSPVRGVHKSPEYMKNEVKRWTKYVGGATVQATEAAKEHFEKLSLRTKDLRSCVETELAKLFETTYRAWMIACFQEMHRISRHFNADFDGVVDFLEDTHRVRLDRPIMFPGVIGGHCIIPNAELLLRSHNSEFLRLILKSNAEREKEVKDKSVFAEVEKVKKRAEAIQEYLINRM
jgi:UDP-N-acetyl-D-mannosaminuronate dehydrogenase